MGVKVCKFGGSSLADAKQFRKAADIIKSDRERRYVVVSAPGRRFKEDIKVTDLLISCFETASSGDGMGEAFECIKQRFDGIVSGLGIKLDLRTDYSRIEDAVAAGAGKDYLVSRGEYLNARIMAAFLGYDFIDATEGIWFRTNGELNDRRTYESLGKVLSEHERAVIPGFYGSLPKGRVKTFSRGGSDISGAIVARAVKADIYENWTDVSGMLMADPRIVADPEPIEILSYREVRELAYMGATVMHDQAILPVREVSIPINIRNTNEPDAPGTMILPREKCPDTGRSITGIAGSRGFASIDIEKLSMNQETGFGRRIMSILEDFAIPFEHLPTGIDTMSVVVQSRFLDGREDQIIEDIYRETASDHVSIDHDLALVAIVGRGIGKDKGISSTVFKALADENVNIRMIDQSFGSNNIIIGVCGEDCERAIRAIYSCFSSK